MHMADVATEVGSVVLKLGIDDVAAAHVYGFAAYELELAGFVSDCEAMSRRRRTWKP